MQVQVRTVDIPAGSTIATLTGKDVDTGDTVLFAGDHRACREIGEAIKEADGDEEALPVADVEDWQILTIVPGDTDNKE
jgi:hypothetical protein